MKRPKHDKPIMPPVGGASGSQSAQKSDRELRMRCIEAAAQSAMGMNVSGEDITDRAAWFLEWIMKA